MRKKIKITEAGIYDFFKSFFRAKAAGKEKDWINSLEKKSPELADIWKDYDDVVAKNTKRHIEIMKSIGADTSHWEKFAKERGIEL
jgi:hypothetical protein